MICDVVREQVNEVPSSVADFDDRSPVQSALVVVVISDGSTTMICPFEELRELT